LAYDETIDLAVVKVNATGLSAATICKKPVSVGATIYAIGSSRGMTNTYSQGIITYADRIVDGVSYVQHDASITHGNSGGPLINVYGEVIGINTWGISDSQNLNFAVFSAELDNLIYGTPLTLEEFYLKECDVFERIKNYIIDNGSYNASNNSYRVTLGTTYSSDYSSKYTRLAYYYVDDNEITLDFLIDDGDYWVYFTIDENVDGSYYWSYFDENNYEMNGTLYSSTYDSDTLLGYSYNNISSSSERKSVRELASLMISVLCSWIDNDFGTINVSAEDLGFYYY
jgi:serine protease Do